MKLCPGSVAMERGLPETPSEWSELGDEVHAMLSGTFTVDRKPSNQAQEAAFAAETLVVQLLRLRQADHGFTSEERLFLHNAKLQPIASGKYDRLYLWPDKALIIDFKSLYGEVAPAERNLQLRALAVLVSTEYNVDLVDVAIVQPNAKPQVTVSRYERDDLIKADAEWRQDIAAANMPDAPRIAGPVQCKHCRAKAVCPEAQAALMALISRKDFRWDLVSPAEKLKWWDAWQLAKEIGKAIEQHVKADLKFNPDAIPGLLKLPDQKPREIVDIIGLYTELLRVFTMGREGACDQADRIAKRFTALCSIGIGDASGFIKTLGEETGIVVDPASFLKPFVKTGHRDGKIERGPGQ